MIKNDEELAKVITDPDSLSELRFFVVRGSFIIIYTMNHAALEAWAKHLGGRLPKDNKEQLEIWNAIP